MVNTYADYLKTQRSMCIEQMEKLHQMIMDEVSKDEEAMKLYVELIESAIVYSSMRARWPQMSREEKMDQDSSRTSHHDSVITHFNMLARYLRMQGKSAEWRDMLGDEKEDPYIRKAIGDFGCYLVFVNSICAR